MSYEGKMRFLKRFLCRIVQLHSLITWLSSFWYSVYTQLVPFHACLHHNNARVLIMLLAGAFNILYKNINLRLITSEIRLWRPSIDSAISERKPCIFFYYKCWNLLMLETSLAVRLFHSSAPFKHSTCCYKYNDNELFLVL